jgi:hypothetical protein
MAHAYVDPGSGAMIWQIAAAAVIGSMFYVRRFVGKIKDLFGRSKKDSASAAD